MSKNYIFFICYFIIFFVKTQEKNVVDGIFATVGEHVILHSDIDNQLFQYKSQNITLENENQLKENIIKDLFFEKVLLHFALVDSIEVDQSEIDNTINQRLFFFEEQLGSLEKIETYFNKSINQLKEEMQPLVKNQLLTQKMKYEITKNINISPKDIKNIYKNLDSLPFIETQFQIGYILKVPDASKKSIEEVLTKLEDLRLRIVEKGADFSTMAILYSEDPGSSRNGGAYFGVKKGDFVKEFESVAFSLKINEISDIFKTEYGYHVAQLIDRRGNEVDIRHILMTPKISNYEMLSSKGFLDSLRQEIILETNTFSEYAAKFSDDNETKFNGGLLINPNTNSSLFSKSDIDNTLFNNINSLDIGEMSDPIYIKLLNGQEAYRIVKLVDKIDGHIANIEDDYAFLQQFCYQIKQEEVLMNWYSEHINKIYIHCNDDMKKFKFYNDLLND